MIMYEVSCPVLPFSPEVSLLDIRVGWLKIDIIPTDNWLFPEIRMEAKMDIQIKL